MGSGTDQSYRLDTPAHLQLVPPRPKKSPQHSVPYKSSFPRPTATSDASQKPPSAPSKGPGNSLAASNPLFRHSQPERSLAPPPSILVTRLIHNMTASISTRRRGS